MKCLRSFNFVAQLNANFAGADIDTWTIGSQHFWSVKKSGTSTFFFEGFKSVDVYSITAIGDVLSFGTGFSAIVQDWNFILQINGKVPLISGGVNTFPNDFGIQPPDQTPFVTLNKFYPKLEYSTPVRSVSSVQIGIFEASGIGNESLTTINLDYNLSFKVEYLYEGEDQEFAFL